MQPDEMETEPEEIEAEPVAPVPPSGTPSVPDTKRRLVAHGLSILMLGIPALVQFLREIEPHLLGMFPDIKWISPLIGGIGGLWNLYLRFKDYKSLAFLTSQNEDMRP